MRTALQEVLEAEMTEALGAEKGERAAGRQGYRSGYYGRTLITRVGKLELRVPQDRTGRFSLSCCRWRDGPARGRENGRQRAAASHYPQRQRNCISFLPLGVPQPVTASYPGAALNPPTAAVALLPSVISVQATAPRGFPPVLGFG